jgi:hypothetical protein
MFNKLQCWRQKLSLKLIQQISELLKIKNEYLPLV